MQMLKHGVTNWQKPTLVSVFLLYKKISPQTKWGVNVFIWKRWKAHPATNESTLAHTKTLTLSSFFTERGISFKSAINKLKKRYFRPFSLSFWWWRQLRLMALFLHQPLAQHDCTRASWFNVLLYMGDFSLENTFSIGYLKSFYCRFHRTPQWNEISICLLIYKYTVHSELCVWILITKG